MHPDRITFPVEPRQLHPWTYGNCIRGDAAAAHWNQGDRGAGRRITEKRPLAGGP
jgi:hypothetical protein